MYLDCNIGMYISTVLPDSVTWRYWYA